LSNFAAQPAFGVADIVRQHGARFRARHADHLVHQQKRALDDIERCRTAALGGHVAVYACNHEVIAYNSCRNRHCPRCLQHRARDWVEQKEHDLLPVPYFHVVFTLPQALLDVPAMARATLYEALFAASAQTLLRFGRERLNGQLGFLAVLHTWGQTLTLHPHVHCVVAGGAFNKATGAWTATKTNFLFAVRALSKVFRGKMIAELRRRTIPGVDTSKREQLIAAAARNDWVVHAKPPFGGPAQVLRYLARYTHRVAISDHRIVNVDERTVTFSWKDYRDEGARKLMTLDGVEWLRRFSQHILPRSFTRLRSYGFLANANKAKNLVAIRATLAIAVPPQKTRDEEQELRPCRCPVCGVGLLLERRPLVVSTPGADTS